MVDTTWTEWWCPTEQEWSDCPGPCPDGTEHGESRKVPMQAERVVLL